MKKLVLLIAGAALILAGAMAFAQETKEVEPPPFNPGDASSTGGPDPFGYTYIDSNEPGGPVYLFKDISGSGTDMNEGDDSNHELALGFMFDFYGVMYDTVWVASNGAIAFAPGYFGLGNECIPDDTGYNTDTYIGGYWDDLDCPEPGYGGAVYYELGGSPGSQKMIVQWNNCVHYATSDTTTFQLVLFEGTNNILAQYADPSNEAGSGGTGGIQGDANTGLQYFCNEAVLTADLAVCYVHPDSTDPDCSKDGGDDGGVPATTGIGIALLVVLLGGGSAYFLRRK
jgi:hypothetical protein